MHKWGPKKCSFVFVLVSLTSLVSTDKIQKQSSFRTRLVGLISTKTKEYFFWPPFMHSVYATEKTTPNDMESDVAFFDAKEWGGVKEQLGVVL